MNDETDIINAFLVLVALGVALVTWLAVRDSRKKK
jgi:hypothetical protein